MNPLTGVLAEAWGLYRRFAAHGGPVLAVRYSPDGRRVLTGCTDRSARLIDLDGGRLVRSFDGHAGYVRSVAFAPDGRRALTGGYDYTARLWDLETGRSLDTVELHEKPVLCVALTADGKQALSGGGDGAAHVPAPDIAENEGVAQPQKPKSASKSRSALKTRTMSTVSDVTR